MKSSRWAGITVALLLLLAAVPAFSAEGDAPEPQMVNIHPGGQEIITSITTIVIFCVLLAILGKYAWAPIVSGLQARETKIRKSITDAEAAQKAAEAALARYNAQLAEAEAKVRDIINSARADADKIGVAIRTAAQSDAEETKERATREIEAAKNDALTEIYQKTADLATSVAEKIIRRSLNATDQRDLVDQSLSQMQNLASKN